MGGLPERLKQPSIVALPMTKIATRHTFIGMQQARDLQEQLQRYFVSSHLSYSDRSGRYNSASGATDSFGIPSGTTKIKVGWSSAYVTTVAGGKMSMASASQTVTLK